MGPDPVGSESGCWAEPRIPAREGQKEQIIQDDAFGR